MNGDVITICEYAEFNHSFIAAAGAAQDVILSPAVRIFGAGFIGASITVHARAISPTAPAGYQVIVRPTNPSRRDPSDIQYLLSDASCPVIGSATNPTAVPGLTQLTTPMTQLQHPFVKVLLRATPPPTGVVQLWIIISVQLIWRADV